MKLKHLLFFLSIISGTVLHAQNQIKNNASNQINAKTLQQIQLLVQEKESRTPAQRKIDSYLLQAVREKRGQKMMQGLNLEPAKIATENDGRIKVDISADVTDVLLNEIRQLGGTIIYPSKEYHTVRAVINLSAAENIAALSEVKFIAPAAEAMAMGSGNLVNTAESPVILTGGNSTANKISFEQKAENLKNQLQNLLPGNIANTSSPQRTESGNIVTQGDRTHLADSARNRYGYIGQGIRIGVISDSYNNRGGAGFDVASGELPGTNNPNGNTTPVTILEEDSLGLSVDEGRALLQIIHDIAPQAQLFFASAVRSQASYANNIKLLRSAPNNCDIIVDDIGYADEPVFQDGIIAQAVNTVTANGALYFSSAGNNGSVAKNTAAVWEGDFNGTGNDTTFADTTHKTGKMHNFGTAANPVYADTILTGGRNYTLHWSDPIGASSNDYDLYLLRGDTVKAFSTNIQNGTQNPFELISSLNFVAGDRLVVFKTTAAAVRAIHLSTNPNGLGKLSIGTAGQTHGHSAAANSISVAAASALQAYPNAFSASNQGEAFNSDGPRRIFYNADSTPVTPGNILFGTNGGLLRAKPDVTAADRVATTVTGFTSFPGTAASAAHAAGIAALVKSAKPALTNAQIKTILSSTAIDIEAPGYDYISGFGILNAFAAMQATNAPALPNITLGSVTTAEGSFSNNNSIVEPGEIANAVIQLNNTSISAASNVTAVLTTSTPGVSLVQGTSSYGTIGAASSSTNAAAPFVFSVNRSVSCGTVINFLLTVTATGSAARVFPFTVTTGVQALPNVTASLGTPATGAGFNSVTGLQNGRLAFTTPASTCGTVKTTPSVTAPGSRTYDAYKFKNSNAATQCVTATLNANASLYAIAYNANGYIPGTGALGANFLADQGSATATQSFSFNVAANDSFTIVVHAVNASSAVGTPYTLGLSLANCAPPPSCTPVNITPASIASSATGSPYTQSFAATGGSGSYTFSISGTLPPGLSFSGNTLSGTPTQAGSFPVTINASDIGGCPTGSKAYTLIIAGNAPASVTANAGTPQTVSPGAVFPVALQATVKDASNNPLSGVSVKFTAPPPSVSGSGTFAGGDSSVTVITNASGIAIAPTFTANNKVDAYIVTAEVNGVAPANFNLTNACAIYIVTINANTGTGSLRDVVAAACAGSVITFNPSVTQINLASEIALNKSLTIKGGGPLALTISGNNLSRIFNISGSANNVSVSGITFTKGRPTTTFGGGAILISAGTVNISNCVLTNNNASFTEYGEGGGIDVEGGTVLIDKCVITKDTASYDGGGITNYNGTVTITNSTISENIATGLDNESYGGGIYNNRNITLINSTINSNNAIEGGGLYSGAGTVIIDKSSVVNNTSRLSGGGLATRGSSTLRTTITNSTVAGNSSSNTTSSSAGGGIYNSTTLTLTNCSIVGNSAQSQGGNIFQTSGSATFKNTIIAGGILTQTSGIGPDIRGNGFISADYNFIQSNPSSAATTISGQTSHNIMDVNPNLLPLADYGGGILTMLPMPNSPLINKGDPMLNSGIDERGFARVIGAQVDMGAVEANYAITANAGTPQTAVINAAFASPLQAKVTESANNIAGITVKFTAPATGASGTFPGSSLTATAVTNASGIAVSPVFTANNIQGTYNVTDSIGSAFSAANFILTNTGALPVMFGAVTALLNNCTAQIQWQTFTEINSKHFTVEYSIDGVNFSALATVAAKGNSTTIQDYTYNHTTAVQGTNYYRIKQTDNNGAVTYSKVVIVVINCEKSTIVAYPNPIKNKLTVLLPATGKYTLQVYDATGRKITQSIVGGGTHEINASLWAKGMYTLSILQEGQAPYQLKVIKN